MCCVAVPPEVSMPVVMRGFYMQPVALSCSVESDVPFRLRFTRDGATLGEDKNFQSVSTFIIPLCLGDSPKLQLGPHAVSSVPVL